MKSSLTLLFAMLAFAPSTGFTQALLEPPPPPPTEVEAQIAQMISVPQLERVAAKLAQDKDWRLHIVTLKRLVELRPHNGHYKFALAAAYSQTNDKRMTYDTLVRMQSTGYAYDIAKDPRFSNAHGTKVWDYLVANFNANAAEFGEGKLAFELPADDLLIETLAWDPAAKRLLAGSAREGKVYKVGPKGELEEFIAADAVNGMWSVMEIAVDAPRDLLYVASSAITHFKHAKQTDYGRSGVFKFQLSSGKFLSRYELPVDGREHILNSIAIAPRGDVFAADGLNRMIFKIDGGALKLVIQNPALTSIRGMAVSDDGKTLYFADYELGLFGLDLATGQPFEMAFPENLTLFSIDGLSWYEGNLVAVQAGFPPARVMRMKVSDDGRKIERMQALEAGRKSFGTPTRGVVAGDHFYFIANTQKGKYDAHGLLKTGAKLAPLRVMKSNLRFAWNVTEGQVKVAPK